MVEQHIYRGGYCLPLIPSVVAPLSIEQTMSLILSALKHFTVSSVGCSSTYFCMLSENFNMVTILPNTSIYLNLPFLPVRGFLSIIKNTFQFLASMDGTTSQTPTGTHYIEKSQINRTVFVFHCFFINWFLVWCLQQGAATVCKVHVSVGAEDQPVEEAQHKGEHRGLVQRARLWGAPQDVHRPPSAPRHENTYGSATRGGNQRRRQNQLRKSGGDRRSPTGRAGRQLPRSHQEASSPLWPDWWGRWWSRREASHSSSEQGTQSRWFPNKREGGASWWGTQAPPSNWIPWEGDQWCRWRRRGKRASPSSHPSNTKRRKWTFGKRSSGREQRERRD